MRIALLVVFTLGITSFLAFAQDAARTEMPSFKGVELYSWKDTKSGAWQFSLLPGTNRDKPLNEIKNPSRAISGVNLLKERIDRLAEGEEVYWLQSPSRPELSYPDDAIVQEIVGFAALRKVKVVVKQ